MEAIKNLRESSALLSNLGFDSYRDVANLIYGYDNVADVCDIISCPSEYVDTLVGMVRYNAELRNKIVYDALVAYATEDDYRAIYAELYILLQNDIADIDEDIYLHDGVPYSIETQDGHRVVCPHFEQTIEADEIKEAAFISDEFEVFFNE